MPILKRTIAVSLSIATIAFAGAAWYFYPQFSARAALLKQGIEYSEQSFVESACRGNQAAIALFVQAGMQVNARNTSGLTVLHCAAMTSDADLLATLIAKKADVNANDQELMKPLHRAVIAGNVGIVKLLLDAGAKIDAMASYGTPISLAAQAGNEGIVRLLLERGANVTVTDKWGGTALNAAMEGSRSEPVVRLLLEQGANPNSTSKKGSALYWAARNANLVRLLLDKGANTGIKNEDGSTPLHAAVQNTDTDASELLLNAGADIGAIARNWGTPLHVAVRNQNLVMTEFLIKRGVDVNSVDCCGNNITPLHNAVESTGPRTLDVATLLISMGANVNARARGGRTPLMHARHARLPVVKLLVDSGANIHARDDSGYSVLWWFKSLKGEGVAYLIDKGAKE